MLGSFLYPNVTTQDNWKERTYFLQTLYTCVVDYDKCVLHAYKKEPVFYKKEPNILNSSCNTCLKHFLLSVKQNVHHVCCL